MQEVGYSNNNVIVPDKEFPDYNMKCSICHHSFLKSSALARHRSHGHKNNPPYRNLIGSDTNSLSYLRIFQTFTTLQWIILWSTLRLPI